MTRFFVQPEQIGEQYITITGDDAYHLARVLRAKPGELLEAVCGDGYVYSGEIVEIAKDRVLARRQERQPDLSESPLEICLVQGLPKGEKMELVLQKGTELGVKRFIPLVMARTVVRLEGNKAAERLERWRKIVREAAKQCRRGLVPEVDPVATWEQLWPQIQAGDLLLLPWEEEQSRGLRQLAATLPVPVPRRVFVIIGPEGGIAPEEAAAALEKGAISISLGPRILRTETAAITAISLIQYLWGDLGGEPNG
ncbi:MAG: 16S rRNA (uracil(1498)-N(3))-methyltransferase [Bacillota bacterium]